MTYQLSQTAFTADRRLSLYPAEADADNLGSVLLANTLLRAAAALSIDVRWPEWGQDITAARDFPVSQLLAPETQTGCALLCSEQPTRVPLIQHTYRRAFLQELSKHFGIYDGFFSVHFVPDPLRYQLYAACQQESLICALENRQA